MKLSAVRDIKQTRRDEPGTIYAFYIGVMLAKLFPERAIERQSRVVICNVVYSFINNFIP